MIDFFQQYTTSLPPLFQWLGVMAAGAVPFIESYFGSVIGVAAGLNPFVAVVAAVVGDFVSMAALVWGADAARRSLVGAPREDEPVAPRRRRLRHAFDRFGVPGVSLLGQTILPSQITAAALVRVATAGHLVFEPRGQWHTFWNAGDTPARILELISPGGFEHAFRDLDELGNGELTPKAVAIVGERHSVDIDIEGTVPIVERHGLTM